MAPSWSTIRKFAHSLGADIIFTEAVHFDEFGPIVRSPAAPLALNWDCKLVIAPKSRASSLTTLSWIIHELGHLLACRSHPARCNEHDFMGWEWLVAKKLNVAGIWRREVAGVTALEAEEFPGFERWIKDLSRPDQFDYLRSSVARGQRYGNIDKSGRPVAVR
jgi:hypothetical protein